MYVLIEVIHIYVYVHMQYQILKKYEHKFTHKHICICTHAISKLEHRFHSDLKPKHANSVHIRVDIYTAIETQIEQYLYATSCI